MSVIPIESEHDDRLAIYRALPKSQLAKQGGYLITEGDTVTERFLASRYEPVSVMVEPKYLDKYVAILPASLPIYLVSEQIMQATVGFPFHRGVMGCGVRPWLPKFETVVPPSDQSCLLAIFPATQDPTNLGTMLRTCAAFGVSRVILGPNCADPFSRRVIRVSMGTIFQLEMATMRNPPNDFAALRQTHGVELCATVLAENAIELEKFQKPKRAGIVIGGEGHGLPPELVMQCQHLLTIPMQLGTDSLNAAIATGIFLYELTRAKA